MTTLPLLLAKIPQNLEALKHKVFDREKISKVFDPRFYLEMNPDVETSGIDPLVHYLRFGIHENRAPNAIFDPVWYEEVLTKKVPGTHYCAYSEYLSKGLLQNLAPNKILLPIFSFRPNEVGVSRKEFEQLVAATNDFRRKFGGKGLQMTLGMFLPSTYDGNGALSSSANGITRLVHFLNRGAKIGLDPGPMFQSKDYLVKLAQRAETLPRSQSPLMHFLEYGIKHRIVPNSVFDDSEYVASYPDLSNYPEWPFWHFLQHGIFEGRKIGKGPRVIVSIPAHSFVEGLMNHWNLFWAEQDHTFTQSDMMKVHHRHAKVLRSLVNSPFYAEIVRRATDIDPALGDIAGIKALAVPPFFDMRYQVLESLRNLAQRKRYDTVICMPWLRTGGADLVSCLLAEAIKSVRPDEQILVIRTEHSHYERPEWMPDNLEVIDASPILKLVSAQEAEDVFLSLLLGLTPTRLFNVNSNLCWRVMARFGQRLGERIRLYSYLFCWDQLPSGARAGYPSLFFAPTAPWLDGILTDSRYLRDELIRIYSPPDAIQTKMFALPTPLRLQPTQIEVSNKTSVSIKMRPLVLWAGRLDRQKRFDLTIKIANSMPEVDFACWGEAMLDTPPNMSSLPRNLALKPSFKSFDEMPLASADLWLFTSSWEGIPTLLIELAFRDMPIVASAVGGVPELINEDTGYLVTEIDNAEAYVSAIRGALADPEGRKLRARRLREHAQTLHTKEIYQQHLNTLLNNESLHDGH